MTYKHLYFAELATKGTQAQAKKSKTFELVDATKKTNKKSKDFNLSDDGKAKTEVKPDEADKETKETK